MTRARSKSAWTAAAFIGVVLVLAVGARSLVSGPEDNERLAEFERTSGLDVGPDTAWFASGLSGDGAVYAIMATDPFGMFEGRMVYHASYRYARVGYSWIAASLVLGRDDLVLLGLSMTGLLSVASLAFLACHLRETLGRWSWLLVANPAVLIGFLHDTAEPLALLLLASTLLLGRVVPAAGLALVRETFLFALTSKSRTFLLPLGLAIAFRLLWVAHFGDKLTDGISSVAPPFAGLIAAPSLVGGLIAVSALVTLAIGVRQRNLAWIVSGVLVCCFGESVLVHPINTVRAAGLLPVLWAFGPNFRLGLSAGATSDISRSGS